jgi:hypothetical protein
MDEIPKSCLIVCGGLGEGVFKFCDLAKKKLITAVVRKTNFLISNSFRSAK